MDIKAIKAAEKERKEYRRMLHLAHTEFEDQYKWNRYALKVCRSLSFRIGKLLCKYDKRPNQKEVFKCFYGRQSIKDLCTEGIPRLELEEENTRLKAEIGMLKMGFKPNDGDPLDSRMKG